MQLQDPYRLLYNFHSKPPFSIRFLAILRWTCLFYTNMSDWTTYLDEVPVLKENYHFSRSWIPQSLKNDKVLFLHSVEKRENEEIENVHRKKPKITSFVFWIIRPVLFLRILCKVLCMYITRNATSWAQLLLKKISSYCYFYFSFLSFYDSFIITTYISLSFCFSSLYLSLFWFFSSFVFSFSFLFHYFAFHFTLYFLKSQSSSFSLHLSEVSKSKKLVAKNGRERRLKCLLPFLIWFLELIWILPEMESIQDCLQFARFNSVSSLNLRSKSNKKISCKFLIC